jgi:ureidoglycolate lyase
MTSANGSPLVPKVVQIWLERLTAEAFAPFGQLICARDDPPIFEAPHLRSWRQDFAIRGAAELMYIHYAHQPMAFSAIERHFRVTQTFIPLAGAASVMVVAAPTDLADWASLPEPGQLRAFYASGTVGLMLWRGTWHALTRFPAGPDGAGFAFLTDRDTQRELERQRVDGTPPGLTQEIDYRKRFDVAFEVIDPDGLLAASSVG